MEGRCATYNAAPGRPHNKPIASQRYTQLKTCKTFAFYLNQKCVDTRAQHDTRVKTDRRRDKGDVLPVSSVVNPLIEHRQVLSTVVNEPDVILYTPDTTTQHHSTSHVAAATSGRWPSHIITKRKHFRWWNVFDDICGMDRWSFWSWSYV